MRAVTKSKISGQASIGCVSGMTGWAALATAALTETPWLAQAPSRLQGASVESHRDTGPRPEYR